MAQIDEKSKPETADKAAVGAIETSTVVERFEPVCVRSPRSPGAVLERVTALSKRGRLAGFERRGQSGFVAAVHGKPFDSELVCEVREVAEGSRVTMKVRMRRGLPAVFGVVLALCVWPGVLLTDSLMNTWFSWYPNETWKTYVWYVPLTVVPLPWAVRRALRQSRASGAAHAAEQAERIRAAVDGAAG